MELMEYVKPELMIVAVACYFIGMALKNTSLLRDKLIPVALGIVGIVLSCIYVAATSELNTPQEWAMALFTGLTQGILVAGLSTYVNQLVKQLRKTNE